MTDITAPTVPSSDTSTGTTAARPTFPSGTILGYPRIGPRRELKTALEAFWAATISVDELEETGARLRARTHDRLIALGLTQEASIPSGFSFYDQMLDVVALLGAVPDRFADLVGPDGVDLPGYFALARGDADRPPLEMTKWLDTNYHYLVPEIGPETPVRCVGDRPVREFSEALDRGVTTRPVLVGPVTFLLLSKAADGAPDGFRPLDRLDDVVAAYGDVLRAFAAAGAPWVQLDEPALVADLDTPREEVLAAVATAYRVLADELTRPERPALFVAAGYGGLGDAVPVLAATGIDALGVDLVRGSVDDIADARRDDGTHPLAGRTVVGGVVNGRNVWRADLDAALATLKRLAAAAPGVRVAVGTSTSLQHVPHDVADEPSLDPQVRSWLAFADQKVGEVMALAVALADEADAVGALAQRPDPARPLAQGPDADAFAQGPDSDAFARGRDADAFARARAAVADRASARGVCRPQVRARVAALTDSDGHRTSYEQRHAAQAAVLPLPPLPTTVIGSFPQTPEIRRTRTALRRGELTAEGYDEAMRGHIADLVALQERLGIDVLVHGEPERNDMVQYFAELLDGFVVTQNGWVQSYGSRCTRPSILWGDVARPEPMTVRWATYAQSLTHKPVKGMLTGPVTILAWSFVRDDQPLGDTARQVALALRDEVADLETAGIGIIQVDEPALRELLPLRKADRPAYLEGSVEAFRIATSGVCDTTQIHTHLCYSEFGAVMGAIDGLDADVTSIEAARSRMEVLPDVRRSGFARGIGPGVYDIHSPRVPEQAEIEGLLVTALESIPAERLWVNPDCGLKTRRTSEVEPALVNVVAAARAVRARIGN